MNDHGRTSTTVQRRTVLGIVGTLGAGALAGCAQEESPANTTGDGGSDDEAPYEVWAIDQGTDIGYVYQPSDDGFSEVASIDFAAALQALDEHDDGHDDHDDGHDDHEHSDLAPHMIDFSSDFEYAVVAVHHGDGIAIVRTEDREVVAAVPTGSHSHFAAFSPDDEYITVDVADENAIKKVDADLNSESFEITDSIVLTEREGEAFEGRDPTCHYHTGTGYTYHTLGPSYHDSGLAVVDHDEFELVEAYTGAEVPANCGVFPHPDEEKVYLTAGLPSDPDAGNEGVSEYFVMDAETHEVLKNETARGTDAHGLWVTPDSEELWIVNRETNDGVVVDTETDEIVDEIDELGPATGAEPGESDATDILAASPGGEYMFVSLRGPNPVTADPQAATGVNPGFAVLDTDTRERVDVVQPDPENEDSDFHAVGVRPLAEFEGNVSPL